MAHTGKQRSLTVIINRTVGGVQENPRTYYGCNEFTINNKTYPEISPALMAAMPTGEYLNRLSAFKLHVESLEPGLNIESDTIKGCEAYRENLTACPIN